MKRIDVDLSPAKLQDELERRIFGSITQSTISLMSEIVIEQIEAQLTQYLLDNKITRFTVKCTGQPDRYHRSPVPLAQMAKSKILDLGNFEINIVGPLDEDIDLGFSENLQTDKIPEAKVLKLKTVQKTVYKLWSLSIPTEFIRETADSLVNSCQCAPDLLLAHIEGVWDWALVFICKVCGKSYFCECFRKALEIQYPVSLADYERHRGTANELFLSAYKGSSFRTGICHLCRDIPSDLFFCHPQYGSPVLVHYGPYIRRNEIEKHISRRDAENEIRELLGIAHIGEGWVSEVELLKIVRQLFPDEKVVHQASPDWLGLQRLDIYLPNCRLAIEYQGKQHYEPVSIFGGEEGYLRTMQRDRKKAELCAQNGVNLLYFRYDETIDPEMIKARIAEALTRRSED